MFSLSVVIRVSIALSAMIAAIAASLSINSAPPPDDVWFMLNSNGDPVQDVQPTLMPPTICQAIGISFCSRKYTSYTVIYSSPFNPETYYVPGHNIPGTTTYKP